MNLSFDPQLLSVTPQHFDEHLEILRRYACPISLKELASALAKDKLPHRSVVITFDDGYADNLQYAKPLLEKHDSPATAFITAGQVDSADEFWWDELERMFLQPGKIPASLYLTINGNKHHWCISEAIEYTEQDYKLYSDWHVERSDDPTARHRLYRSLYQLLHSADHVERQACLSKLRAWTDQDSESRASHRTLTADEVVLLSKGGLIEVGAHTTTHPVLANLTVSKQWEEIMYGKACLEDLLGHSLTSFSYPHGSYTDETIALVKEAGFHSACSSDTAVISRGMDTFRMPRFSMRDWNGEEFYRWLKGLISI